MVGPRKAYKLRKKRERESVGVTTNHHVSLCPNITYNFRGDHGKGKERT